MNDCSTKSHSLPFLDLLSFLGILCFPFFEFVMVILPVTAIASFIVLATSVVARSYGVTPFAAVAISKHVDPQGNYCPVQKDQRRITHLKNKAHRVNSSNLVVDSETAELNLNNTGSSYAAKVGIGNPPTYCKSCASFLSEIYYSIMDPI